MVAADLKISVPTLRARFDALEFSIAPYPAPNHAVNLVLDATFFGREYGYLCFCDTQRIVYFEEIESENRQALIRCLHRLTEAGYRFKSFTLDGKRGFIQQLQRMFPGTPIQMCLFHQKMIIRRYITNNPKSTCGKEMKIVMGRLGKQEPQEWIDSFVSLQEKYQDFLNERNEKGQFMHRRIRSAFRSLRTNQPLLFVYQEIPDANIPNTTNCLEGRFAHLKEKIKIHRGLQMKRKKNAIAYILKKS